MDEMMIMAYSDDISLEEIGKAKEPLNKSTADEAADLWFLRYSLKNRKCIPYSSVFQTIRGNKIACCQHLPVYSELPLN